MRIDDELKPIIQTLVKAVNPVRIYLDGDYNINQRIDYNLWIITGECSNQVKNEELKQILANEEYPPQDIIMMDRHEFRKQAGISGTIEQKVADDGRILLI